MSILPFVAIDGGPYRQRLLSGSSHWRPPPTRFLYSSKHAAGTHNKPLIKACLDQGIICTIGNETKVEAAKQLFKVVKNLFN